MSEKWNAHGRNAAEGVKRAAEAAANGVHHVTNFVARSDGRVADGAQAVTQVIGVGLGKAGEGLATASKRAGSTLHGSATRIADAAQNSIVGPGPESRWRKGAGLLAWGATKALTHAAGLTANVVTVASKAVAATGRD